MKKMQSMLFCFILLLSFVGCVPGEVQTASIDIPQSAGPISVSAIESQEEVGVSRPVAVVVDNHQSYRPNSGLSEADIVFETALYGGVTRFMALYNDYKSLPVVGPVREMVLPLMECVYSAKPIYISDAISLPGEEFIAGEDYAANVFDARYGQNVLWLNEKRLAGAMHAGQPLQAYQNRYTDGGNLAGALQVYEADMNTDETRLPFAFSAGNAPLPADVQAAEELQIVFSGRGADGSNSGYSTRFQYDRAAMRYRMLQNDGDGNFVPSTDEATESLIAFDNVLVLFAEITERANENDTFRDVLEVQFTKGGSGVYCYGGSAALVTWQKNAAGEPFALSASGAQVQLNQGATYVAIVDVNNRESFVLE